jgi:demethylspheroidene O-methyltransferase
MPDWFAPLRQVHDAYLERRARVYANPGFQRWAATFWPFRGISRRRASALFDLSAGFVYSQVLTACVRLGLLEALADGPRTPEAIAGAIGLDVEPTERLLRAAAALKLTEPRLGGRYGLGIHGASYVGNPAVARMVEHHALLYADLADPVGLLKGEAGETALRRFWQYGRGEAGPYSDLMASSLGLLVDDLLEAYPVSRHRRVLDVGGGEGAFLEILGRRVPTLERHLFDLPTVAERARRRLGGGATVHEGDLFDDPLPGPVDLVTLLRILHDHDDDDVRRILRKVHDALSPGGTVLIAEPMSGTRGAEAMGDAYFGFYLLAMGQGRPRTAQRLFELLREAGFVGLSERRTRRPILARVLVGTAGFQVSK